MRSLSLFASSILLAGAALLPAAAHAAPKIPSPVVVEWFQHPTAKAGQHDTVYVRVVDHNKPVQGVKITAQLLLGKKVLHSFTVGKTDKKGTTKAAFTIPSAARGKTLHVFVWAHDGNFPPFPGKNDVKVLK